MKLKEKQVELIVYLNADGEVIEAYKPASDEHLPKGRRLEDKDYDHEEHKRIPGIRHNKEEEVPRARLVTTNWCCWKIIAGKWRCVWPC